MWRENQIQIFFRQKPEKVSTSRHLSMIKKRKIFFQICFSRPTLIRIPFMVQQQGSHSSVYTEEEALCLYMGRVEKHEQERSHHAEGAQESERITK
jgi:hypothetical protein